VVEWIAEDEVGGEIGGEIGAVDGALVVLVTEAAADAPAPELEAYWDDSAKRAQARRLAVQIPKMIWRVFHAKPGVVPSVLVGVLRSALGVGLGHHVQVRVISLKTQALPHFAQSAKPLVSDGPSHGGHHAGRVVLSFSAQCAR